MGLCREIEKKVLVGVHGLVVKRNIGRSLLELRDSGFFKEKRTISDISDALGAKGLIVSQNILSPYLLKLVRKNELKREKGPAGHKKVWKYYYEGVNTFPRLPAKLLRNKKFEREIRDLNIVFEKSGTCTALLLRKILEKAIVLAFSKHGMLDKLHHGGKYLGLEKMIDIASKEKVNGAPFLLPRTAKKLMGIKFLGDVAAHDFLADVDMEDIIPQMPFIITALKELSRKF